MTSCTICGGADAVNPSVEFPICGACKRSVWQRSQPPPEIRALHLERALDELRDKVVEVRRQKAACSGIASLGRFHPLQTTPPKT